MLWPRRSAISSAESSSRFCPSNSSSPVSIRPGGGISRMMESAVTLLPQPDSPTMQSTSPLTDPDVHAVDRFGDAVAGMEPGAQIAHLQDRICAEAPSGRSASIGSQSFRRGSRASRIPSPRRLKPSTVIMMARPGKNTRWGALNTWLRFGTQHGAPFGGRRLGPQAEEGEPGRVQDGAGDAQRRQDDDGRHRVGHDTDQQNPRAARRRSPWRRPRSRAP